MSNVEVLIIPKVPKRKLTEEDGFYFCYDLTCPPWEKELYYLQDEKERSWLFHVISPQAIAEHGDIDSYLEAHAAKLKKDHSPNPKSEFRKCNPLLIQLVFCHAKDFDEVRSLLGEVKLHGEKDKK